MKLKLPKSAIKNDADIRLVKKALEEHYRKRHPSALIDVYKRHHFILRIRIIDPDFKGKDWIQREEEVWPILEKLPEETFANITMLLLITPA